MNSPGYEAYLRQVGPLRADFEEFPQDGIRDFNEFDDIKVEFEKRRQHVHFEDDIPDTVFIHSLFQPRETMKWQGIHHLSYSGSSSPYRTSRETIFYYLSAMRSGSSWDYDIYASLKVHQLLDYARNLKSLFFVKLYSGRQDSFENVLADYSLITSTLICYDPKRDFVEEAVNVSLDSYDTFLNYYLDHRFTDYISLNTDLQQTFPRDQQNTKETIVVDLRNREYNLASLEIFSQLIMRLLGEFGDEFFDKRMLQMIRRDLYESIYKIRSRLNSEKLKILEEIEDSYQPNKFTYHQTDLVANELKELVVIEKEFANLQEFFVKRYWDSLDMYCFYLNIAQDHIPEKLRRAVGVINDQIYTILQDYRDYYLPIYGVISTDFHMQGLDRSELDKLIEDLEEEPLAKYNVQRFAMVGQDFESFRKKKEKELEVFVRNKALFLKTPTDKLIYERQVQMLDSVIQLHVDY